MLRIIDKLTGYRDVESFDSIKSFDYEISHSALKVGSSIRNLLKKVKSDKIKYVKISKSSILNKDSDGNLKDNVTDKTRHFFDFLTANMIYDIIINSDNRILTNWYIKTYMSEILDVIENFEDYPYDYDDFNRMNYGIFINDSKEYGGNCQIFSMIFELVNYCSQDEYLKDLFVNLCPDKKFKKYFEEIVNNSRELLKTIHERKFKNSKLNLVFWVVSLNIMMLLNKLNGNDYVITTDLLKSGFEITNKITLEKDVRADSALKINCVFYICEEHCHVGFITPNVVFDIDNMNSPTIESVFISRACDYYNFNKFNLSKYYYTNLLR